MFEFPGKRGFKLHHAKGWHPARRVHGAGKGGSRRPGTAHGDHPISPTSPIMPCQLTARLGCGLGRASADETPASPLRAKRASVRTGPRSLLRKLPHHPALRGVLDRLCPAPVDHTRGEEPAQGR